MSKNSFKLLVISYLVTILGLFFYSFTQVDLNLTLSQVSLIQDFQKFFIQIGYFNRPLSTAIFLSLVFLLFIFYFLLLWLVKKEKISQHQIWWLIILTSGVLLFSYPAFSHDIFNYMFDAKTVITYKTSPYSVRPLDFPNDPWLHFMHWVHRQSIYPQFWIGLSIIPYVLGFGKFLLILYNFKMLISLAHLGTGYFIYKILKRVNSQSALLGLTFFAFNPLILIENLVSSHQDIVMMFFAIWAIYLLVENKKVTSFFLLALSVQIKYLTIFLLPLWFLGFRKTLTIFLIALAFLIILSRTELQPWYFVWVLPLIALSPENDFFTIFSTGFSLSLLLRYAPFLFFGNWDPPVPTIKFWVTTVPLIIVLLGWVGSRLYYFKVLKR